MGTDAGHLAPGEAVEAVVLEVLGEVAAIAGFFALFQVTDFVPLQLEVLIGVDASEGGGQVAQQTGVVFILGAAGDAVTQFFADDIAAGIHAVNGVVGAGGLTILSTYHCSYS